MGKRLREDDQDSLATSESVVQAGQSPAKIVELEDEEVDHKREGSKMQCLLPPHLPLSFDTTEDFDVHYSKEHTNRCSSCGRNFPSSRYLNLHIDENHNPVRESLAAKGEKTYACFIEDCQKLCSTPQKRRLHLIDKHMFPKAYNFRIVDRGIDRTDSMLQTAPRRRFSTNTSRNRDRRPSIANVREPDKLVAEDLDENQAVSRLSSNLKSQLLKPDITDPDIRDLAVSMASLQFLPPSVRSKQHSRKPT